MGSVFHELTDEEIKAQKEQAHSDLRELRFTYAISRSLPSPAKASELKKNIARMNTVLRERELGLAQVKPKTDRKKKK